MTEMIFGPQPMVTYPELENAVALEDERNEELESALEGVPTIPASSDTSLEIFVRRNEGVISEYVFKRMKLAVVEDREEVVLFRIAASDLLCIVERDEYGEQLSKLCDYFLKDEQYEKVAACKKLINIYNVDRVIRESSVPV